LLLTSEINQQLAVAFMLHALPARVQITAPENFYDVAVLIDSKDSAEKA